MVLAEPPDTTARAQVWLDRFAAAFPEAAHRTFAVDGTDVTSTAVSSSVELGLAADTMVVMTATSVCEPPHPNSEARVRAFRDDEEWEQSIELAMALNDNDEPAHSSGSSAARTTQTGHWWTAPGARGSVRSSTGAWSRSWG